MARQSKLWINWGSMWLVRSCQALAAKPPLVDDWFVDDTEQSIGWNPIANQYISGCFSLKGRNYNDTSHWIGEKYPPRRLLGQPQLTKHQLRINLRILEDYCASHHLVLKPPWLFIPIHPSDITSSA